MATSNQVALLATLFFPLISGILVFVFFKSDQGVKRASTLLSLIPLILSIYLLFAYDRTVGGMQFQITAEWIPVLRSRRPC